MEVEDVRWDEQRLRLSFENRASNQLYVVEGVEVGGVRRTRSFGGFLVFDYILLFLYGKLIWRKRCNIVKDYRKEINEENVS